MKTQQSVIRDHPWLAFAIVLCFGLAGCSTYGNTSAAVAVSVHEWHRRGLVVSDQEDPPAPPAPVVMDSRKADAADLSGRPQVDLFIAEALQRNPGIRSAVAYARAKLERIPQVMSPDDPVLRAVVRPEPIETAAGDVYFTLGVTQKIPLLARLERAGNMAAAETRMAIEQLNDKRIQLIADVERTFWQLYLLDRNVDLTGDNRRLLEELQGVVATQYRVGRVQQADLLRVQTELAKLRDDEHRYKIQRASAAAALNQLCDYPPGKAIATTTVVEVPRVSADVSRLLELAEQHNPRLAALREQIQGNREAVELANLGYWPDFTVGFEWNYLEGRSPYVPPVNPQTGQRPPINRKSENGDDNWAVSMQFNVPIWWDRIEAGRREANHRLLQSQHDLHDAHNLTAFRIFDAWSRAEAQQHTLAVLDNELIPQAGQTYNVSLTSYQAGNAGFITLIVNWRRWLDFELMRQREIVDLETALSDLQREVGLQLVWQDSGLSSQSEGGDHD
ncbi:MAG: TolC family protein [Planctomycetota bacterium]